MINVGVVGLGQSGWHQHAASLHTFPDYWLVAVCDRSPVLRERAAGAFSVRTYAEAGQLCADPEVEVVVVATPNNLHAEQAMAAMEAGKDVVVEKPMSVTLAEADEMVATARRTGRVLTVFHNRRWDRDFLMVEALKRRKVLGDILTLDSRIYMAGDLWGVWSSYGVPEFRPQWRTESAYGGGYLADWGPHMVEQVLRLAGEMPVSVAADLRGDLWTDEVDDYFNMRLAFPSGLTATMEASNNGRIPPPRWYVVGTQGTLIARGEFDRWADMRVRAEMDGITVELEPRDLGVAGARKYGTGVDLSDHYYADLADALSSGRPPTITAEHARNVMVVLDAARRSDTSGETIELHA
jgi:predicted dehydrogenase